MSQPDDKPNDKPKDPLIVRAGQKTWTNLKAFASPSRGAAEVSAYLRGGLKDLQDAVVKAFPDAPSQHSEMGMFASPTPQQVTAGLEPGHDQVAAELARMRGQDHTQSRGR